MVKLLYLIVGIFLKQTIDEFKDTRREKVKDLECQMEALRVRPRNIAAVYGSAEAARAIADAQYQDQIGPDLVKLHKAIVRNRLAPVIIYAIATLALMALIGYLEYYGISGFDR